MKKLLLLVLFMCITTLGANATTSVRYNCAGAPISVSHGWHSPVSVRTAESMSAGRRHYSYSRIRSAYPSRPYKYRRNMPMSMRQRANMAYYPVSGTITRSYSQPKT